MSAPREASAVEVIESLSMESWESFMEQLRSKLVKGVRVSFRQHLSNGIPTYISINAVSTHVVLQYLQRLDICRN